MSSRDSSDAIQAYPLQWPAGRARTPLHAIKLAQFKTGADRIHRELAYEIERAGGADLVVTTNVQARKDGMPYSRPYGLTDLGVAIYFKRKGKMLCFPCDRWTTINDNLWAIVKTLEALRGIERWGSGEMMDQAYTGFTALPAPESWWQVLGLTGPNVSEQIISSAHRRLAMEHHPDRGGDTEKMARINRARDMGLEAINS